MNKYLVYGAILVLTTIVGYAMGENLALSVSAGVFMVMVFASGVRVP